MKDNPMHVRKAKQSDYEAWLPMWKGYQEYYEVDLADTTQNTWERLMNDDPKGPHCLVCEDDEGKLVGFTHYLYHPHTWQPGDRCYLVDLYTNPQVRGKSLGRKLIEAVYEAADAHGAVNVYWLTQHFNEAGRRLYDRVANLTPFIMYRR